MRGYPRVYEDRTEIVTRGKDPRKTEKEGIIRGNFYATFPSSNLCLVSSLPSFLPLPYFVARENMKKVDLQPQHQNTGGYHNKTGVDGFCDLNWLSSEANDEEEDTFQRNFISREKNATFTSAIESKFNGPRDLLKRLSLLSSGEDPNPLGRAFVVMTVENESHIDGRKDLVLIRGWATPRIANWFYHCTSTFFMVLEHVVPLVKSNSHTCPKLKYGLCSWQGNLKLKLG
ncbi:hypothetical protein DVH24_033336 [Malus domestica]|uniref:Uncharacterized protein n=1 Tax=Malus domestica TaxID=3750 RepID=A0A498JAE3_MALDO|nr:hypothetical protein DVH24_033336 [Malus domestica]